MSFASMNLDPQLQTNVATLGYEEPTPIQTQAIPAILAGRDVLGLAQTGTGKTAAFALPILQRLMAGPRGQLRTLVIAPTRELAQQVHEAFEELGRQTGLRSVTMYGGVSMEPQVQGLRRGADIVVACPGRLLDHLRQGTVNLSRIEVLVLDEADRMLDMGFLPNIRDIIQRLPAQRQNLLFSATMPRDISQLAAGILRDPVSIQIEANEPVATVAHALYPVEPHLKTPLLLELLKRTDTESVLVFTRTKHRARRLSDQLQKAGHKATCLQGNLSQNRRRSAMDGFRRGTFQVLVATDIAARGIDVSAISHVINYDMPDTVDAYTHRIGRTGRAARTGDAFTLTTREDADLVRGIERLLGAPLERRALDGFDYTQAPAKNAVPNAVNPRVHRQASSGAARDHQRYGGRPATPGQSSGGHRRQASPAHRGRHAGVGAEAQPRGTFTDATPGMRAGERPILPPSRHAAHAAGGGLDASGLRPVTLSSHRAQTAPGGHGHHGPATGGHRPGGHPGARSGHGDPSRMSFRPRRAGRPSR